MIHFIKNLFTQKETIVSGKENLKVRILAPGDGIDPILHELLRHATVGGHEKVLHPFILKFLNAEDHREVDDKGNLIITIEGDADTMFSCHLDVVGREYKENTLVEVVTKKDKNAGFIRAAFDGHFTTLGGDDKAGAYIMTRMIIARVPGTYIFHVGEEEGCVGSKYIRSKRRDWLKQFKRCIAFDRRDTVDVIYKQRGKETCSLAFAEEISNGLNAITRVKFNLLKPCPNGSYTDSASYEDIIPECTNLSVGYFDNHGATERLDGVWLQHIMLPACLQFDWSQLGTYREPKEYVPVVYVPPSYTGYNNGYQSANTPWEEKKLLIAKYGEFDPLKPIPHDLPVDALAAQLHDYVTGKYQYTDLAPLASHMTIINRRAKGMPSLQRELDEAAQLIGDMMTFIMISKLKLPDGMQAQLEALIGPVSSNVVPFLKKDLPPVELPKETTLDNVIVSVEKEEPKHQEQSPGPQPVKVGKKMVKFNISADGSVHIGTFKAELFKKVGKKEYQKLQHTPHIEGTKVYVKMHHSFHYLYTVGKHGVVKSEIIKLEWPGDTTVTNQGDVKA